MRNRLVAQQMEYLGSANDVIVFNLDSAYSVIVLINETMLEDMLVVVYLSMGLHWRHLFVRLHWNMFIL